MVVFPTEVPARTPATGGKAVISQRREANRERPGMGWADAPGLSGFGTNNPHRVYTDALPPTRFPKMAQIWFSSKRSSTVSLHGPT